MNEIRLRRVRNILILLGVWNAWMQVTSLVAFGTNFLPHYIASSARPGSRVILTMIGTLPFIAVAIGAGDVIGGVVMTARPRPWAIALAIILGWHTLVTHGMGWGWLNAGWEHQVGIPLAAACVGIAAYGAFWLSERRVDRRVSALA